MVRGTIANNLGALKGAGFLAVGVALMCMGPGKSVAGGRPFPRLVAYTWDGSASDDWDNSQNWTASAGLGYPDDCSDDATIPSGDWAIDLITETIDDLAIEGDVHFDKTGLSATLTADSLTIVGPCEITFESNIRLKTQSCPGGP